jgi:hypothetical protein
VKVAARSPEVAGRALLIGMALTEDPVTTRVLRGENARMTLVEHHVVRRFNQRSFKLDRTGARAFSFPIDLAGDPDGARFRVVVFAQDRVNGQVFQANELPWNPGKAPVVRADRGRDLNRGVARRRARNAALNLLFNLPLFDPWAMTTDESNSAFVATCPACGSPFNPPPTRSNDRLFGPGFRPLVGTC